MSMIKSFAPKSCYKTHVLMLEPVLGRPAKDVFASNLDFLCAKRGVAKALSDATGIDPASITRLRRGLQVPTFAQLDAIADHFGIPVWRLYMDLTDPDSTGIDAETAYRILGEFLAKKRDS